MSRIEGDRCHLRLFGTAILLRDVRSLSKSNCPEFFLFSRPRNTGFSKFADHHSLRRQVCRFPKTGLFRSLESSSCEVRLLQFVMDDAVWNHAVFSKNRDRLLTSAVAQRFFAEVNRQGKRFMSDEHFTVDGR
jgi:hypothetical protein